MSVVPDLEVRKDEFCTGQLTDITLTQARENIITIDGEPIDPGVGVVYP